MDIPSQPFSSPGRQHDSADPGESYDKRRQRKGLEYFVGHVHGPEIDHLLPGREADGPVDKGRNREDNKTNADMIANPVTNPGPS